MRLFFLLGAFACLAPSSPAGALDAWLGPEPGRVAWLRSPPESGAASTTENAAIMQPAATDHSDPGLVGMMVRCHAGRLEPVLVVVEPLPPRSVIRVTLEAKERRLDVTGTPVITGAGIALPIDVPSMVQDDWRDEPDLDISIATAEPIRGVVSLKGFVRLAMQLEQDCRADHDGS